MYLIKVIEESKLTKHQIHRTNDSHSISQQVALGDVIETTQVSETGGTNVASVRALTSITYNVHAHLTLGGFDHRVCLTGGYRVTLGVEQEVVNESLHVLLHGRAGRGGDLVVLNTDRASRHIVEALVNNAKRLAELLHTAKVAIVAVTVLSNRDVEFNLVVGVIGLALADIPWDTGATEHNSTEGQVQGFLGRQNTNTTQTLNPDTVIRQHFLGLVDTVTKLGSPLVDIVEQTNGDILVDTSGTNVSGVKSGTGDTLIEFLYRVN